VNWLFLCSFNACSEDLFAAIKAAFTHPEHCTDPLLRKDYVRLIKAVNLRSEVLSKQQRAQLEVYSIQVCKLHAPTCQPHMPALAAHAWFHLFNSVIISWSKGCSRHVWRQSATPPLRLTYSNRPIAVAPVCHCIAFVAVGCNPGRAVHG